MRFAAMLSSMKPQTFRRRRRLPMVLPFAAAAIAGCTHSVSDLNDGLSVGDGAVAEGRARGPVYRPPTLDPDFGRPQTEPAAGASGPPAPTTLTIDRGNWEITRIEVPNDRAAHQPIYTRSLLANDEVARNRGTYPTAMSASQHSHRTSSDAQILEAAMAPAAAAADIVLFLPRAIINPPWTTVSGGFEPYRRVPPPSASVSPVITGGRPLPTRAGRLGIPDPAAAPVQVPVGEYPAERP